MEDFKKLMTIGDIAKSLGITRRMIINYEDRGLITPDVREGGTGYRYYTVDMLTRIRTIRILQDMGLSLDEIRNYFNDSTDLAPILARLENLRDELNLNIEKIRERMKSPGEAEILFSTIPQQTIYRRSLREPSVTERTVRLREVFAAAIQEYGSDTSRRMFFIEFSLDDPDLASYCIAIPKGSKGEYVEELPETQAVCVYHHGAYEELVSVREQILDYAQRKQIELSGTCRHIYLEGPPQHKDPKKFITQVAVPIVGKWI